MVVTLTTSWVEKAAKARPQLWIGSTGLALTAVDWVSPSKSNVLTCTGRFITEPIFPGPHIIDTVLFAAGYAYVGKAVIIDIQVGMPPADSTSVTVRFEWLAEPVLLNLKAD